VRETAQSADVGGEIRVIGTEFALPLLDGLLQSGAFGAKGWQVRHFSVSIWPTEAYHGYPLIVIARLFRATGRGTVLDQVAQTTSRAMTMRGNRAITMRGNRVTTGHYGPCADLVLSLPQLTELHVG
jgi:hypothetical protein